MDQELGPTELEHYPFYSRDVGEGRNCPKINGNLTALVKLISGVPLYHQGLAQSKPQTTNDVLSDTAN